MPFSAAILRARGEAFTRMSPLVAEVEEEVEAGAGAGVAAALGDAGAGVDAAACGGAEVLGAGAVPGAGGGLAGGEEHGEALADGDFGPLRGEDFSEYAVVEGFHFHGGLVGFDFGDDVAGGDFVALLFAPLDEGALGHGVAEFWHFDVRGHDGEDEG